MTSQEFARAIARRLGITVRFMSNTHNTAYLESMHSDIGSYISDSQWHSALDLIKELELRGFKDEAFKLTNDLLLAQRDSFSSETTPDYQPGKLNPSMDMRDAFDAR